MVHWWRWRCVVVVEPWCTATLGWECAGSFCLVSRTVSVYPGYAKGFVRVVACW